MGIAMTISSDQVRFEDDSGPVPLASVPPRLFSEVMRDVDLFVSVCSIGCDPGWYDQERNTARRDYWERFSFGVLSENAMLRKELVERLLPRLKIAPRCRVDGRWLVVRGDIRTYRIHLGSGNIQMEPNNQYLCIVQDHRSEGARVRLPFEGDATLAIILSKAFMLAEDDNIKDASIRQQILQGLP